MLAPQAPGSQPAPRVSVCMTAYKHERYVGEAVESILRQTFGDFELLITDDCSPDATYEIARSYADPRISAQRMAKRSGPSLTLNAALRRARGEYIALCSSDDRWLPEKLARQLDYMTQHPQAGAVFCRPWLIGENGERLPDAAHALGIDFGGERLSRSEWLVKLFFGGNCLCAITPMLRASAVREVGEFNPLMLQLQDFDYWVRLLGRHELHFTPERLAEYRVNAQGANLSLATAETYARTAYECYQVLRHYAQGDAAEAVAAEPLRREPLFSWQAAAPTRALRLGIHALHAAIEVPHQSFAHFLFALDCMNAHAQSEHGLMGAEDEARLFCLPYFEMSGSSIARNFFLGVDRAQVLEQMLALQQAATARSSASETPSGKLRRLLRQVLGRGRKP